jgi:hypothetical protein
LKVSLYSIEEERNKVVDNVEPEPNNDDDRRIQFGDYELEVANMPLDIPLPTDYNADDEDLMPRNADEGMSSLV